MHGPATTPPRPMDRASTSQMLPPFRTAGQLLPTPGTIRAHDLPSANEFRPWRIPHEGHAPMPPPATRRCMQVRLAEADGAAAVIVFGHVPEPPQPPNASHSGPSPGIPAVSVKHSDGQHCFRTRQHGFRCSAWLLSVRPPAPAMRRQGTLCRCIHHRPAARTRRGAPPAQASGPGIAAGMRGLQLWLPCRQPHPPSTRCWHRPWRQASCCSPSQPWSSSCRGAPLPPRPAPPACPVMSADSLVNRPASD